MLLDSNILIHIANYSSQEIETLLDTEQCSVPTVVKIEVYGFKGLGSKESRALDSIFGQLSVLDLDAAVVERAIALRQKRKMGLADAVIAATALEHGLPLVTRNVDDYRHIEGLRIVNPFSINT